MSTFWRDRRVFVTGGSGLLGGHLVAALLERGAEVICLLRDWVPACELIAGPLGRRDPRLIVAGGDVTDRPLIERILGEREIETVFHLAAQTTVPVANRNPLSTFETNIAGTWRLLEACRRSPTVGGVIVASSDKAYGAAPALPYTESTPLAGRHPYDVSKSCADLIAQSYHATWGLPVVITRCGNFFGGGDLNWNRLIPGTIRAALRHTPPKLRSDGMAVRDWLYVEDGVSAYLQLAERLAATPSLAGEAFNFSTEAPRCVLDVVRRVLHLMGVDLEPVIGARGGGGEISAQHLDTTKARALLGWAPRFSFDEGLWRTIAWYRVWHHQGRCPEIGQAIGPEIAPGTSACVRGST